MRLMCVSLVALTFGCSETKRTTSAPTPPAIRVGLGDPVDRVVGHSWPVSSGNPMEITAADDDRTLVISLPSGRTWRTKSKVTFFSQKDGHVSSVMASPLNEADDFSNVLGHLRIATEELEIAHDALVAERLGEWLTRPPPWSPFGTKTVGCQLEPGITFFAEIKPTYEANKWYLVIHFTVDRFFADGSKTPMSS
jgi:hypothetical protein